MIDMKRVIPSFHLSFLLLLMLPSLTCDDKNGDDDANILKRYYTFRVISGVSMGGGAAASLGLKHHEMFDIVASLGGVTDFIYLHHYIKNNHLSGFCPYPDVGELCPDEQSEQDFEHFLFSDNGGTFDRSSYIDIFQDIIKAYGNSWYGGSASSYLPPGVPQEYLDRTKEEMCVNPVVFDQFYDDEYNPYGEYPVITFCDGEDGDPPGEFDPNAVHTEPFEVALAIDVNGNGVRDSGEPVIRDFHEPFLDTGIDGLFDEDEPGYDSEVNPDPEGDNYDYLLNPSGTENNMLYDEGEPYEDAGTDGVYGTSDSPFDFGEGNGRFDFTPAFSNYLQNNPRSLLSSADLSRLNIYIDAGIRDHFKMAEMGNHFFGTLMKLNQDSGIFDDFPSLLPDPNSDFDPLSIDFTSLPSNIYLRYGDPDATEDEIEEGDGGHVGTPIDAYYRIITLFAYISHHLPEGDFTPTDDAASYEELDFYSDSLNETRKLLVVLPPGYEEEKDKKYPVVYFFHGYGQDPSDFSSTTVLIGTYMRSGDFQKMIIVYPDGRCREGECNRGSFYANQATPPFEKFEDSVIVDLIPYIEEKYRVKEGKFIEEFVDI